MKELLDKISLDGPKKDEVLRFIRATETGNAILEPFGLWRNDAKRFPHIASVARDVLVIQSSCVASESRLFSAGNLITDHRQSLEDEIITTCLCTRSWSTITGSL